MSRPVPLPISIRAGDGRSISRQIVDSLRLRISTGETDIGAQLPSVRALAVQLTVNPNTVAKAYGQLTAEGWLESRPGLGLFVAKPRVQLSASERDRRFGEALDHFVNEVVATRYPIDLAIDAVDSALSNLQRKMSA